MEDSRRKCKCGKGEVISCVEHEEESDYPLFNRGAIYSYLVTSPVNCESVSE